ncbi:MAG: two-component sensor histidine kinase [Chitinophagaceae bacterium]|nr:MAG: two-component sensor histidine kinase [Chitinophagaceae bacterium]
MQHKPNLDAAQFSEYFDWQPIAFTWMRPLFGDDGSITDFVYEYGNDAALSFFNLDRERLGKIRVSDTPWLTTAVRGGVLDEAREVYHSGVTAVSDIYYPIIERHARVHRIRFRDGVLTTIQDKTDEKRAIQELHERTQQLQQSNSELEEFAYVASHDLQEPLRKISTFSDRLALELAGQLSPGHEGLLQRLQSAAGRMKRLIDDLLLYSRAAREVVSTTVDLNTVVQEVLLDLESVIQEMGAQVQVSPLPRLEADARQLQQLFQNLIGNALKYHRPGVPSLVSVSGRVLRPGDPAREGLPASVAGDWFAIEVRDNGIGFEQKYATRIFQVFQRLHGRAEYEGSGIGLAIVQKVANRLGGVVRATSEPGEGAVFEVLLPVKPLGIAAVAPASR